MYLKSLEMQGFKSFPDHTAIEFHPGITAIVGPNGSGKSNVTDAIRWVLGEQSAKSLRGSKMEDVIFNGTEERRRMSLAEISIHFDNRDHLLPIDYETVVITRRYFRSGESEYLINRSSCRLKDIVELFADTGIGRDGYSIIGQGKVDDILSERSDDRRKIFDEAAGIVKFKMRKQEASRKLERSEENLLRIQDILGELEQRLLPLKKQAAAAENYFLLEARLKELDLGVAAIDIKKMETDMARFHDLVLELEAELKTEENAREELRQEREASLGKQRKLDEEAEGGRQLFQELSGRLSKLHEESALILERRRHLKDRLQLLDKDEAELQETLSQLQLRLKDREGHAARLQRNKEHFHALLLEDEASYLRLSSALNEREQESERLKQEQEQRREKVFELKSENLEQQSEVSQAEEEIGKARQERAEKGSELSRARFRYEEREETQKKLGRTQEQTQAKLALLSEKIRDRKQRLEDLDQAILKSEQEEKQLDYRIKTLRQLEENREGYHPAVREIMREAKKDAGFARGLRGPLAELIRVPERFEMAVEIALGAALHHIVTENEEDASRLINFLKKERAGRETFLPMSRIKGRDVPDGIKKKLAGARGFLGFASELIETEEDYRAIVSSLLGHCVITETLEDALLMARKNTMSYRVVSLEGDMVHPGGSMSGGFNRKGISGLLSRAREIEEAELRKNEVLICKESKCEERNSETEQLRDLAEEDAGLRQKNLHFEKELYQTETLLEQERKLIAQLEIKIQESYAKENEWSLTLGSSKEKAERSQSELHLLEQQIKELAERIAEADSSGKDEARKRDELRDAISDLRVSLSSIEESLNGIGDLRSQLEEEQKRGEERLNLLSQERAAACAGAQKLDADERETVAAQQSLEKELTAAQESVKQLLDKREEEQERQQKLIARLDEIGGRRNEVIAERERCQNQFLRLEELAAGEKNRIWDSYQLSSKRLDEWKDEIKDEAKARRELNALRRQLKDLNSINRDAPREYQEVSARFDFIHGQKNDIERSRRELRQIIEELESSMRRQFQEEFSKINANFRETFASLFNGGRAELLPAEGDLLDCGIEIKAQPPGKRLQNLTLLSGGERSLTAIALLFAIFQLRPAPFCVLDEVESSLDDANVLRFTDYVKNYTDSSQFILVTHRKGTMEASDRLYGVTMKERGISRILSMEMGEAENALN